MLKIGKFEVDIDEMLKAVSESYLSALKTAEVEQYNFNGKNDKGERESQSSRRRSLSDISNEFLFLLKLKCVEVDDSKNLNMLEEIN